MSRHMRAWPYHQPVILASYHFITDQATGETGEPRTKLSVSLKMCEGVGLVSLGHSDTTNIQRALREDRKVGTFTDLSIVCKDRQSLTVHKLMLVASSKLLADILGSIDNTDEDPVIILPDFEKNIILRLLATEMLYGDGIVDGDCCLDEASQTLGLRERREECSQTCSESVGKKLLLNTMEGQDLPSDFLDFLSEKTTDIAKSEEEEEEEEEREKSFIRRSVIQRNCHVGDQLKPPSQGFPPGHRETAAVPGPRQKKKLLVSLLSCDHCGLELSTGKERESHAGLRPECGMKCRVCHLTSNSFDNMIDHLATKHEMNLRKQLRKLEREAKKNCAETKCRICKTLVQKLQLADHFTAHHAGKSPLVCDYCGHIAMTESRLARHRASHLAERNREHCNICMKEFRNKVSLRTHKNMVHKMGKQYTCSYCGKILYSSQYVKKHEATHTGEKFKAVVCKYCGKTVEYTKLKNHELIHTGEKPFKCSDCDYQCIQRSNLRIHMRAVHKKELPRLAVGQKRYSGVFMDGTVANNDPFDLRSIFHQK